MAVLPDVLQPGLKVVFCGTAASSMSAATKGYYAGPGNRFWEILYKTGLTPRLLTPGEFREVAQYGIGLTNLVPDAVGNDAALKPSDFDPDGLREKINRYAPCLLAFNGKRAAMETFGRRVVTYGRQADMIGTSRVVVLPSTSGAARGFWDESYWRDLAEMVRDE